MEVGRNRKIYLKVYRKKEIDNLQIRIYYIDAKKNNKSLLFILMDE